MQPRGKGTGYRGQGTVFIERSVRFAAAPQPLSWSVYAA